ncbi:hypothetical protein JCM10213_006693, partial [Rhodosporidiobolus nylandii]
HLLVKEFCEDVDYLPISEEVSFYLGEKDGKEAAFLIYVDDGLAAGDRPSVESFLADLADEFDTSLRGPLDGGTFLGRELSHDVEKKEIVVKVEAQIAKMLESHNLTCLKPVHTPIQVGTVYKKHEGEPVKKDEYLSLLGRLLFIAQSRPDIQLAVSTASRYSSNPSPEHHSLLRRIAAYLSYTRKVGMRIKGTPDGQPFAEEMVVYVDSDFAGDVDTRRSTTGAVLQIDGNT